MRILNEAELLQYTADDDDGDVAMEKNLGEFSGALELAEITDLETENPGELSPLQKAADLGLNHHVQALLSKGADPNGASSGTAAALVLAAKSGHSGVVRAFKEHKAANGDDNKVKTCDFSALDANTRSSVLHSVLRKPFSEMGMKYAAAKEEDYKACLKLMLEDVTPSMDSEIREVINVLDRMGNTPLHYATQMWSQSVVRMLLERGANIGMKNVYDEAPVEDILPETMEAFLDEFCLTSHGDLTNKDFKVTVRYDFLAPPLDLDDEFGDVRGGVRNIREGWNGKRSKRNGIGDAENQKSEKDSDDDDDRPKKRTQPPLPETGVLWHMAQSEKHRPLLKHPVITSFLWLKWQRISRAYNQNLAFYLSFVLCLTSYIFVMYGGRTMRGQGGSVLRESCGDTKVPREAQVLWHINTVLLVILGLRELLQFGTAPRRYFFSLENWLEVTLIALIALLLFMGGYGCYVSAKRHMAAIVIVISWSILITMIGRHPKLSEHNIYMTMFYKVTTTFIMFLVWYSLFIIAFSLGFYILLHRDDDDDTIDKDAADYYPFFDTLDLSVVKTFTMFVGELEFGDLPIETPVGYLFFLAFIFLIVVVMMNLLNGLAVSDTGVIRAEAEINYYVSQVEVISYIESMLLGDPFNFLSNWPTFVWLRRFPSCSLGKSLYRAPPLRSLFHTLTGASGLLLFYDRLPDKTVTFYPNHEPPFCGCLGGAGSSGEPDFHPSILEAAKAVVLAKAHADEAGDAKRRLERTEKLVMELKAQNAAVVAKLDQILGKLGSG